MEVRPAAPSDLDAVITIRQAALSRHAPPAYSDREVVELLGQLEETEFRDMIGSGQLFVAERNGRVVGVAGWTDCHVRHVHVSPGEERAGIGSRLVWRVEEDFQRSRPDRHIIHVNATRNAEAFYEANGYCRVPSDVSPSALFVRMKKDLGR